MNAFKTKILKFFAPRCVIFFCSRLYVRHSIWCVLTDTRNTEIYTADTFRNLTRFAAPLAPWSSSLRHTFCGGGKWKLLLQFVSTGTHLPGANQPTASEVSPPCRRCLKRTGSASRSDAVGACLRKRAFCPRGQRGCRSWTPRMRVGMEGEQWVNARGTFDRVRVRDQETALVSGGTSWQKSSQIPC